MTPITHAGAVLCVALIALGQVLFKLVAASLHASGSMLHPSVIGLGAAALTVYGIATVTWILLLQTAPLGRLYPYMALSFVMVALASWLVFHESLSTAYLVGLALIVSGLLVIAASAPA